MPLSREGRKWSSSFFWVLVFVVGMCSVQWNDLAGGLADREVYKNYFLFEESILEYRDFTGALDYVTNEYLWHFLVGYAVDVIGLDVEVIFLAISAFCLVNFGLLVVKDGRAFSLIFLVNPLIVDLVFSQFRSAFAISLLFFGYLSGRRSVFVIVAILCAFIHTASLLFLVIFFISYVLSSRLRSGAALSAWTLPALFATGFFLAFLLGPLREGVLSAVGDRRAEYADMSSSFLYVIFWLFLGFFCLAQKKEWFFSPENSYAFIVLSLVASNLLFSGYSLRFIGASMPFLISGMLQFNSSYRKLSMAIFVPYAVAQWVYWVRPGVFVL